MFILDSINDKNFLCVCLYILKKITWPSNVDKQVKQSEDNIYVLNIVFGTEFFTKSTAAYCAAVHTQFQSNAKQLKNSYPLRQHIPFEHKYDSTPLPRSLIKFWLVNKYILNVVTIVMSLVCNRPNLQNITDQSCYPKYEIFGFGMNSKRAMDNI